MCGFAASHLSLDWPMPAQFFSIPMSDFRDRLDRHFERKIALMSMA
jgi:hypothetical protein